MNYIIYIPGFTYKSKGPLHIDLIQLISRYKSTDLQLNPTREFIYKDRDFIDLVFQTPSNDEYIHRIGAKNDTSKLKNAEAEPEYTNSPLPGDERGIYSIILPDNFVFGDQISLEFTFYSVYNGSLLQVGKWETSYTPFGYVKIDPIRLKPGLLKLMYFNLRDWGTEEISFEWPSNAEILISTSESDGKLYTYDAQQLKHVVGNSLTCNSKTKEERAKDLHGLELIPINKEDIKVDYQRVGEPIGTLQAHPSLSKQDLFISDIETRFKIDKDNSYYGIKSRIDLKHFMYLYSRLPEYKLAYFLDHNNLGQIIVSCAAPKIIKGPGREGLRLGIPVNHYYDFIELYSTESIIKCKPKNRFKVKLTDKNQLSVLQLNIHSRHGLGVEGYLNITYNDVSKSYSQEIIQQIIDTPFDLLDNNRFLQLVGWDFESGHNCKLWNINLTSEAEITAREVLLKFPLIEVAYLTSTGPDPVDLTRSIKECIDLGVIKNPYYYIDLDKSNIKFNNKGSYSIIPVFISETEGLMPNQTDFTIINTDIYNNKLLTAGEDECELLRCIKKGNQDIQLSTPAGLGAESTFCHEARFLSWDNFIEAGLIDLNPFTPEPNSTYCLKITSWDIPERFIEVIVKQGSLTITSSLTNNRLIILTSNDINLISITLKAKVVQVSDMTFPMIPTPISNASYITQIPNLFNTNSTKYISGIGVYKVNNMPASVDNLTVDDTTASISQVIFPVAICLVENKYFTLNNINTKLDYRDDTELSNFKHSYTFRYLPELACYDVAGWYKVDDEGKIESIKNKNGKDMTVFQDMITYNTRVY